MAQKTKRSTAILRSLRTPKRIQDYLNTLSGRREETGYIVRSPKLALADGTAGCMEGALIASAALRLAGARPLLLDLKVGKRNTNDVDHVVAIFKEDGRYGAISKTSHAVLRYREPVYKTVRELALSYFHEYFTDDGKKNLRSFSKPFDVEKHFGTDWIESEEDLYEIAVALDEHPHEEILSPKMAKKLRLADPIEIRAGKITENMVS